MRQNQFWLQPFLEPSSRDYDTFPEVVFLHLSVCLLVCLLDYSKSDERILVKSL